MSSSAGGIPPDDKALIGPPVKANASTRAAGMKVNSIYAQDHWQHKDPRIFLSTDPKDPQDSPFQVHVFFSLMVLCVALKVL